MPYKDTDYKLGKNNEINHKLYRKVAVVNAINEEKIDKAEYLSNKTLIPKPSLLETQSSTVTRAYSECDRKYSNSSNSITTHDRTTATSN